MLIVQNSEHAKMSVDEKPETKPDRSESPPWSRSTKIIVTVGAIVFCVAVAFRFQALIGQVVAAMVIAYILNPLIVLLDERTGLRRSTGILIVYLILALAVIGGLIALGFAAVDQANTLIQQVPTFIADITGYIEQVTTRTEPILIGPFEITPVEFNWSIITNQLISFVQPAISQSGQLVRNVATTILSWAGILLFVFVLSIYIAIEIPQMGSYVGRLANQPGYRRDAERLMREFGKIWSSYLRGQVILGVIIFFVVWLGLSLLGVQNSLALGILSGLLEFIPVLGPVIGAGAAIIVAFFQPTNYLGLSPLMFAGVVLFYMILVQQLENALLVPRIVGDSLDLHPLIVIIAVFMGGSLAGILGAILGAPIAATLKLLGVYAWRKMFDQPPFPKPEDEEPPPSPSIIERLTSLLASLRKSRHS